MRTRTFLLGEGPNYLGRTSRQEPKPPAGGVNAALGQRVILTATVLTALERLALPDDWRPLRPRRSSLPAD